MAIPYSSRMSRPKPIWPSETQEVACFFGFWVREVLLSFLLLATKKRINTAFFNGRQSF